MPRLAEYRCDDPALRERFGDTHHRFRALVEEAERKARPLYERIFGRAMGIDEAITRIFEDVDAEGDAAVLRYSRLFDRSELPVGNLRVSEAEIDAAWGRCDPDLRAALTTAAEQIAAYQRTLLPHGFGADADTDDGLGVRWTPLERVGGYVPGGTAGSLPLCSTVLMNLVPARVAGVHRLVVATPPRPDGSVADELLAACRAAQVDEIYRVGGVQAIAALACGTPTIARVDKIVGPGNIYVTLAKRQAYGRVDIDLLAGPSEILVIADDSVPAAWIAADLLSQAEHDLAMVILIALEGGVAAAVQAELERQCDALPSERRAVAGENLERLGVCVHCDDPLVAAELANAIAAEHLELLVRDPRPLLRAIRHAGAIFVGPWSPEPIGDYVAGPSHTLPTGGSARMWSGIGADTFLKRTSLIALDEKAFRALATPALALARAEGLEAHARSIAARLDARR